MDKNLLRFYLVAFPILLLTMAYVQYSNRRALEQFEAENPTPQVPATTEPLAEVAEGEPEAGQSPAPQLLPGPERRPAEPLPLRPADVELVTVRAGSHEIVFSPIGGVPVEWNLIDPGLKEEAGGSEERGERTDEEDGRRGEVVSLIDTELDAHGLDRPLEVILKEVGYGYYNELNQKRLSLTRNDNNPDYVELRFESEPTESGLRMIKTYRIPRRRGDYQIGFEVELINEGRSRLAFDDRDRGMGIALGPGLGVPPESVSALTRRYLYVFPILKEADEIEEIRVGGPEDGSRTIVMQNGGIGWGGLHNQYFLMSLTPIPDDADVGRVGTGFSSALVRIDGRVGEAALVEDKQLSFYPRLELYHEGFLLEPGGSRRWEFIIYAGPKDHETLQATGLGLERILFHNSWGWMRALCLFLMKMLGFFHGLIGSWGLAIIALVITVRLATFPIAQIGMRQQAKFMKQQADLKPELEVINKKHKDDSKKRSEEMMKLYRERGVNPFGMLKGCVWMIIQLPIFFALYRLLYQSFDLRGASFLWIEDLSAPDRLFAFGFNIPLLGDHFNLLPLITAATQMAVSKFSTNPNAAADPNQAAMQKQMMYFVPVMILVMTYSFPSGLVLYWLVSNIWQAFQQLVVNRKIMGRGGGGAAGGAGRLGGGKVATAAAKSA